MTRVFFVVYTSGRRKAQKAWSSRPEEPIVGFLGSGNEPLSASLWVWEHCKLPPWRGLCPSRPVGISHYRYSRRHLYIVVTFRVNRRRRLTLYIYISRRRREMYILVTYVRWLPANPAKARDKRNWMYVPVVPVEMMQNPQSVPKYPTENLHTPWRSAIRATAPLSAIGYSIGVHLFSWACDPAGGWTTQLCNPRPVRCHTYGYRPIRRESSPIDRCRVILLVGGV